MTDENKPGMPKEKENIHHNPNVTRHNPNDKYDKDNADQERQDRDKNTRPTHSKE